ncbi:hypothetical protein DRQ12_05030 [candidate division KSB1 bacterium]|nr:MAG: hypothetical protein DRQ12_05030 [candidate division KSB1 bacterium]HDI52027.1 tetratricopeptide repeat protein [Bacteroidota bacterium]
MNGKKIVLLVLMFFFVSQAVATINENSPRKFGIGVDGGAQKLIADISIKDAPVAPTFGVYGIFHLSPKFTLQLRTGYGQLKAQPWGFLSTTKMIPLELSGQYRIAKSGRWAPFVSFGANVFSFTQTNNPSNPGRYFDGSVFGGLGTNLTITPQYSLLLTASYHFLTTNQFDLWERSFPDAYVSARAGITYYFQRKATLEKKPYELIPGKVIATREQAAPTPSSTKTEDDVYLRVIELKSNVDQLKSMLEKKNSELEELRVMIKLKEDKIASLEQQIAQLKSTTSSPSRLSVGKKQGVTSSQFKKIYNRALNKFYARNYAAAIEDFSALLTANPNHRLAGNCQYWIGESYFGMKQYQKAIAAFEKVLSFRRTYKKDDALLMLGICYLRLGQNKQAGKMFEKLLSEYSDSEYVAKARRLLKKTRTGTIS